jgi:hypothetical protein
MRTESTGRSSPRHPGKQHAASRPNPSPPHCLHRFWRNSRIPSRRSSPAHPISAHSLLPSPNQKPVKKCGLPVPSRTEELEQLLLAFLGYWLGDGTSSSAGIGCAGQDLRGGILQFLEKLCKQCGGLGVDTKQHIVYGKAKDYFFLRLQFSFSGGHKADPIFCIMKNLGLSRNGQKVVPPSFISLLQSLPTRHKLFFLAGGICSDGHKRRRLYLITHSLMSKRIGENSRWHRHLGIVDTSAAVPAAARSMEHGAWSRVLILERH